ncbi:hypothetical protein TTHERM_00649150 (macronuclear) [Tetrahymena thermophila SB210]|uniref:Transmembrane protein n=1 Tax=Tetrahymena thermophila (strain SB210) TaxID=312017 RepID=I7M686_TETTS|nr:hypothetical protein TTHERM_00649150 [Tetrahymena thermophila SB210]EAR84646.1 hypothetical protein TTHERM_00649150 [Tetrahymena thermophila SB210]|eukprot:XP_001032309.1 hypothetical protein TTHERM_00649150 [Tetrahymena thermophila SB210]
MKQFLQILLLSLAISFAFGSVCSTDFRMVNDSVTTINLECEGLRGGSGLCHGSFSFNYDFEHISSCIISVSREGNVVRYSGWKCEVGEQDQTCQITIVKKGASAV